MKARFERGEVVGLFPEGTTSSGYDVAPFHSSLFDAAIRAHVDIQPVALRFTHRGRRSDRSEEHTSELQSLMRISYAVFCLKKKNKTSKLDYHSRIAYHYTT